MNIRIVPSVEGSMKKAARPASAKNVLSKPRKKRLVASHPISKNGLQKPNVKKMGKGRARREKSRFAAPIFNTSMAGKLKKYIRPFDPVWPSDEPES